MPLEIQYSVSGVEKRKSQEDAQYRPEFIRSCERALPLTADEVTDSYLLTKARFPKRNSEIEIGLMNLGIAPELSTQDV